MRRTLWKGIPNIHTMRAKLMIAVIACILIPAILNLGIYNALTEAAVKQQAIASSEDAMRLAGVSVSGLLQQMLNTANYIQVNPDMNSYFKQITSGTGKTSEPYQDFIDKNRILKQIDSLNVVGAPSYITVLLSNGSIYSNYSTEEFNPALFREEKWFSALSVLTGFNSHWEGPSQTRFLYDKDKSPYQISLARTLRYDNTRIYGYVIVTMMENRFREIFQSFAGEREVMLVDSAGTVVSGPSLERVGSTYANKDIQIHESKKPSSVIIEVHGEEQLVTQMNLGTNDWHLISLQPYKKAIVNISSTFHQVFLFQFGGFVIILLLLLTFISRQTNPLIQLSNVVHAVREGNLEVRTGIRGQNEIGHLGQMFDQMLDRIQDMLIQVEETQQRKRKAELAMLQAQIQPHFLFNVMNSIRMKVLRTGDKDSANMISSLSKLLRMTIHRDEDDITLHEEIELLGYYVDLMNMRQKEKVTLQLRIDTEAFLLNVPRFILQPLVENAMIHGLNQSSGVITVSAVYQNPTLKLMVSDNGSGMEPQTLDLIKRQLDSRKEHVPPHMNEQNRKSNSLGMVNVVERMRLRFGTEFAIDIDTSCLEKGTCITMLITYAQIE